MSELERYGPRLGHAMLAGAFRGELVPQDPSDEPADAMLAAMRAEATAPTNGTSGKGRTKNRGRRSTSEDLPE